MLRLKDYSWVYKAWQLSDGTWRDHSVPGDINSPVVGVQAPGQSAGNNQQLTSVFSQVSDEDEQDRVLDEVSGWGDNDNMRTAKMAAMEAANSGKEITVGKDASGKVNSVLSVDVESDPATLRHIAVRPDSEGRGIGKQLMETVAKKALEAKKDIQLISLKERVGFYEALGAEKLNVNVKEKDGGIPMKWPQGKMREFLSRRANKEKTMDSFEIKKSCGLDYDKELDALDAVGGPYLATIIRHPKYVTAEGRFFKERDGSSKDRRLQMLRDLRKGYSEDPTIDEIVKDIKTYSGD
jgi:predicted GNAT family acetyltransferase